MSDVVIKCTPLKGEIGERIKRNFMTVSKVNQVDYSVFNPGNVVLPTFYNEYAQEIREMPVKQDDVWLVSIPRTGSTWSQEAVWLIANDLNFERARTQEQIHRCPLLELSVYFVDSQIIKESVGDSVNNVRNFPSPRFVKTHLPLGLLPKEIDIVKPKIVYVVRNPKDMCVSRYHYDKIFHGLNVSFKEFAEWMLDGKVPVVNFFDHCLPFWARSQVPNSNVLFLKYEELKKDLPSNIKKIARFLNKTLSESEVESICEYLQFNNMQKNASINLSQYLKAEKGVEDKDAFIRKGQIGDWKNYFDEELSAKFDKWIEENTKGTGLYFDDTNQ